MTPPESCSNLQLLAQLFGTRGNYRACEVSLDPLFRSQGGSLQRKGLALRELLRRWLEEELQRGGPLTDPASVGDFLRLHFKGQEYESFIMLCLDAQHRLIAWEGLFRGTLSQTTVYPREVVKTALRHNAAAVVLAHNHPSGRAEPSRADQHLTDVLKRALSLMEIQVLDHFIVADSKLVSFAEQGWLG